MTVADSSRRLILRVSAKLLALLLAGGLAYVFIGSLTGGPGGGGEVALRIPVGDLRPGAARRVDWGGRPLWVLHRSEEMLRAVRRPEAALKRPADHGGSAAYIVVMGLGTELGCQLDFVPWQEPDVDGFRGGFKDRCKGSRYDFAGRVLQVDSAPRNLDVLEHKVQGTTLEVMAP